MRIKICLTEFCLKMEKMDWSEYMLNVLIIEIKSHHPFYARYSTEAKAKLLGGLRRKQRELRCRTEIKLLQDCISDRSIWRGSIDYTLRKWIGKTISRVCCTRFWNELISRAVDEIGFIIFSFSLYCHWRTRFFSSKSSVSVIYCMCWCLK